MQQRYLAIDYGTVRVGLAISDPLAVIATGFKTLNHRGKDMNKIAEEIAVVIKEKNIVKIILGIPKRTDGKVGEKEISTRAFADILEKKSGLKPIFIDERYTTVMAHQYMNKLGTKSNKKKDIVDQIAAEILLQNYLDRNK